MTQSQPDQPTDKYLLMLKEIVLSLIDQDKVVVFLFGSRASGHARSRTDVDIGLWSQETLPRQLYHRIRNAVDDSIIPYKVDIVDFTRVDPEFKIIALKDIEIWHEPADMKINDGY